MDRNETVELSRLAAFGEVPIHKALKAITDYYLEKGKSDIDTSVLREGCYYAVFLPKSSLRIL